MVGSINGCLQVTQYGIHGAECRVLRHFPTVPPFMAVAECAAPLAVTPRKQSSPSDSTWAEGVSAFLAQASTVSLVNGMRAKQATTGVLSSVVCTAATKETLIMKFGQFLCCECRSKVAIVFADHLYRGCPNCFVHPPIRDLSVFLADEPRQA
jgi:hypothetical protein